MKLKPRLVLWAIPTLLTWFGAVPASAQIRLGLELPHLRIHISPEAPPPPRVEVRMARPSRYHVWVGGYWDRQDDRWAWAPGHWEEPPQRGSQWVHPRYQREGGAYRYEPGHWSHQRLEEGEDYSRWRQEHGRGHDRHRDHDRDDRERDH